MGAPPLQPDLKAALAAQRPHPRAMHLRISGMNPSERQNCRRRATGRFATRGELTGHIWAIRRQQLYPNLTAIAQACSATIDVVRSILASEEGLADYKERGLPLGQAADGPA
jgi:hypothetical protein